MDCGQSASETGNNESGTSAWYEVTFNSTSSTCGLDLTLTEPGGADSITTAETSASGPNLASAGKFVTTTSGTYYIQVTGGTSGTQFTLTLAAE